MLSKDVTPVKPESRKIGGDTMTIRGALATVLALVLLAAPLGAGAQPPGKVYHIGILGDRAADTNEILAWQTFRDGLRERGWKEGVNIRIESRWVEGNVARLPEMAAELVRLKPDLIATRGSIFTGALKAATSSIPIVFLGHADPVGTGHVASLARPGGNITGMAVLQTEIGPKCHHLRGQDPSGGEAGGPPRGTGDETRARHQHENGEDPRRDDPTVGAAPGGSDH